MGKIRIKIDEKSLYYGLYNDYKRGQTATVSTPINQSKNPNKWHNDIIQLMTSGLEIQTIPIDLIDRCTKKTTAKANCIIDYFYEFKKVFVDGIKISCNCSFGVYIKRETDSYIKNRHGKIVKNTHLGRQKFHYPISLRYSGYGLNIDNSKILDKILDVNGGFAFIVRGFEIDTNDKSINIITSLIGLKGTFLSNVFRIKKGVGKKLLVDEINLEAQDITSDSYVLISKKNSSKFIEMNFDELSKTRAENGRLGEEYTYNHIKELINQNMEDVYHVSKDFPTSPYDIEYMLNGEKHFVEVKATSGTKEVFNMSSGEIRFMEKYKDKYILVMITEVKSQFPKAKKYTYEQIMKMKKEYPSTRFYAQE